ncbi:MAG TPA: CvpA family protein [Myxococcota bacterium]|nr:CvpA family protein [Myxococcota bacterium]HRY96573.1 CvpA family protein [Myxococcota bacterium]HSA22838.1 CvpA family protein [Myxococcota bacterium]
MTPLDLIVTGVVLLFGLLGFLSGFWMQIMRLAVMLGAYLLAPVIGQPLGLPLARALGIPPLVGLAAASFLAFIGLYLVLGTVGWAILRRRRKAKDEASAKRRQRWDGLAGAGLGLLKAGLLCYLILCGLVLVEGPLRDALRGSELGYERSVAVAFARQHNLLSSLHLPVVGDLAALSRLSHDPTFREKVAKDPKVQRLLQHPKLQGLLGDEAVLRASEGGDPAALLGNPRVNQAFQDPEIQKLLSEIDLSQIE